MFVSTLLVLCGMVGFLGADMEAFCRRQENVFQHSKNATRGVLMNLGRSTQEDMNNLCNALVRYSDIAFDTNTMCPESLEESSDQLWREINYLLAAVCPDHSRLQECSVYVVSRYMGSCASIIMDVQWNSQPEQICQNGLEYLECLQNVTVLCSGSQALIEGNVYKTLASTRSSILYFCRSHDQMQFDMPEGGATAVPANQVCSQDMASHQMAQCDNTYNEALRRYSPDICRPKHLFLQCADRVRLNCPSATMPGNVDSRRDYFQLHCQDNYYTCPREVQYGSLSVSSHCLNSAGNIDENSTAYCRKMRKLASCLSGLRDVCPNNNEWQRQEDDTVAARVDTALELSC